MEGRGAIQPSPVNRRLAHSAGMSKTDSEVPRRIPDPNNPEHLSWAVSARPSTITILERANPLAKLVFRKTKRQRCSYSELWQGALVTLPRRHP